MTGQAGHYVALVLVGEEWFLCYYAVISRPRAADVADLLKQAYVVFYVSRTPIATMQAGAAAYKAHSPWGAL
jgi:hypothetical protein